MTEENDLYRAMAERIVRSKESGFSLWPGAGHEAELAYDAEAEAVAARLLELLPPADDGEAVTAEWLKAVGFSHDGQNWSIGVQIGYDCHEQGICSPNAIGWDVFNTSQKETVGIGGLPTRGHVRRLCAALGITLQEPKQ